MGRLALAPLVALLALAPLSLQSRFGRGRRTGRDSASDWLFATPFPALTVLPGAGTIVEANRQAEALFPGLSLLELDLGTLFPARREAIEQALLRCPEGGQLLTVLLPDGAASLLLGQPWPESPMLVALLVPAERAGAVGDAESGFPPLSLLPDASQATPEQQLDALLARAAAHWPVAAIALLRRDGMQLRPLKAAGEPLRWERLRLGAAALGQLIQDGRPVNSALEGVPLYLYPLRLPPDALCWGAVALAGAAPGPASEQAAAHLSTAATHVLAMARLRQRRTQELGRAQQRSALLDQLLADARRGVLLLGGDGRLLALNSYASELLQWPAEDVIGRPLRQLVGQLGPLGETVMQALAPPTGEEPVPLTGTLVRLGSRERKIRVAASRPPRTPEQAILYLEDVDAVASFAETRHHIDRLAVLGNMSRMIAHDLKNPLATILVGIEVLAESLGPDSAEAEGIRLLVQESDKVRRMLDDILSISRQPSIMVSLCSLQTLMDQVHNANGRQIDEKEIHVRRYYDPALPMVEGDPVRLNQMLDNLFRNAVDAVDSGGQIEIVLRPLTLDQMVARGLSPDQESRLQGGVEIQIRDNGPGISERDRQQIFEPDFTTKRTGTGLGLPIVRTIVEQHRGLIFVVSEVGHGTTFQIMLPQLAIAGSPAPGA